MAASVLTNVEVPYLFNIGKKIEVLFLKLKEIQSDFDALEFNGSHISGMTVFHGAI